MNQITVQIKMLDHALDLPLPSYESEGASGMDVRAAVDDFIIITEGQTSIISTGVSVAIPPGYEIQCRSRSGLAAKSGIFVLNSPGTIDADYRGEIKVILNNTSQNPFTIKRSDRIAQLVLVPVVQVVWSEVTELASTDRGVEGFGSTGV
jgi:dUTP pyrophosphatase